MKHVFLFSALFLCSVIVSADEHLITILKEVNKQWSNNPDGLEIAVQSNMAVPDNAMQAIQCHLDLVIQTLRLRDVQHLNASQRRNRTELLNELYLYMQAGKFPINEFKPYRVPVFIDNYGTHCAVGYLMMVSGNDALAQEINRKQRFAYVYDITVNGVVEWAQEYGFSLSELAWIQPAYPPTLPLYSMKEGLDGRVNCMVSDAQGQIYAGGKFSQAVNGVTCNNLALWYSGFAGWDWADVNGGVNGEVHTLLLHNNKLYVGGNFTQAGSASVSNIAVYDISSGQWSSMGTLNDVVLTLAVFNNDIYAGGRFTNLFAKWSGTSWQDITQGFIYGDAVRTMEVYNNQLILGGEFELATGALRKNAVGYDGTFFNWDNTQMGTATPVNDFIIYKNHLFAACDFYSGNDTCALAVLKNTGWESIIKPNVAFNSYLEGSSFNALASHNTGFVVGGNYTCSPMMIYGNHLMNIEDLYPDVVNEVNNWNLQPLAVFDSSVYTITRVNNQFYVGGAFDVNGMQSVNHAVYFQLTGSGLNPEISTSEFQISPNPAREVVQLKSSSKIDNVNIYNLQGQLLIQKTPQSNATIDISVLSAGVYMIQVLFNGRTESKLLVVQ